jgi:3-oxo-5-alpha-steroid 4-dehydrogenase 1
MDDIYRIFLFLIFGFAVVVFVLLFYISAPYGKFMRKGWGPSVRSKWAWMIMELPSPALMTLFFVTSQNRTTSSFVFLIFWLTHYLHRTFVYPFTQSGRDKPYPMLLVVMAFIFNCMNGFINGYGIFHLSEYGTEWLYTWQFVTGCLFFLTGFVINKSADERFRIIRKGNPDEYIQPGGWLFEYVSCPHYFGEMIEWFGWAIMTWSLPGLAFSVFSFANLFPRGVSSHLFYRKRFVDYPVKRKAVIPFII